MDSSFFFFFQEADYFNKKLERSLFVLYIFLYSILHFKACQRKFSFCIVLAIHVPKILIPLQVVEGGMYREGATE